MINYTVDNKLKTCVDCGMYCEFVSSDNKLEICGTCQLNTGIKREEWISS
jgi:hypothetical protein